MKTLLRAVTNAPLSRSNAIDIARQILQHTRLAAGCDARLLAKRLGFDVIPHRGPTRLVPAPIPQVLFDDCASVRDRNYHMSLAIADHLLRKNALGHSEADAQAVARALCANATGVFRRIA